MVWKSGHHWGSGDSGPYLKHLWLCAGIQDSLARPGAHHLPDRHVDLRHLPTRTRTSLGETGRVCWEDLPAIVEVWFLNVFLPCCWEEKFSGDSSLLLEMAKSIFNDLLKQEPCLKPRATWETAGLRGEH